MRCGKALVLLIKGGRREGGKSTGIPALGLTFLALPHSLGTPNLGKGNERKRRGEGKEKGKSHKSILGKNGSL